MKILIIGPPGSGKTTLSKKIAKSFKYPFLSLDDIFWGENWKPVSLNEFFIKVDKFTSINKVWILDGDYEQIDYMILKQIDLVICLQLPLYKLLINIIKRAIISYYKNVDVCGPNKESIIRLFQKNGMIKYTIKRYLYYKEVNFSHRFHTPVMRIKTINEIELLLRRFENDQKHTLYYK